MAPGSLSKSLYAWNVMLSRCVKSDRGQEALKLYNQMQTEGAKPDSFTFVIVLNACASLGALKGGQTIHAQIIQSGFESDLFVGNTLVDMYAKCGNIEDASKVFQRMPTRNVVSWNAMLTGYVKCGEGQKALELFRQMQVEGVSPDAVTFVGVLNACANVIALEEGKHVHAQVIQSGCMSNVFVGSTLVDMYAKCGSIEDARRIFHSMPTRNLVSWNAMLAGCVKCGGEQKALALFRQMQAEGLKPNPVTFVVVLNACASLMALEEGRSIHVLVIQCDCESDVFVASTLVDMYAKCGSIEDAWRVFDRMPARNVVSWNTMLAGYVKCENVPKALDLFKRMQSEGVKPNTVTYVVVLNACAKKMALEEGMSIHSRVIQNGCESDVFVGNSLVDMYGKCGSVESAQKVFDAMNVHDVVSWNAMLAGYVKCGHGQKALKLFQQMQSEEVKPNTVTFVVVLNACARIMSLVEGRRIHAEVIQCGLESDVVVGNSLMGMYGKCGNIEGAGRVFNTMPVRDGVSWNAMLSAYVKCEEGQKALKLFKLMQAEDVKPNCVTFLTMLTACASVMALEEGRHVHAQVIHSGFESDVFVGSTLVDMYAKCGSIEDAQRVFHSIPAPDMVSWNAMLGCFAMHGHGKQAVQLFQEMHQAGVEMNKVTFICLLSACSHAGLVEEGIHVFDTMDSVYGIPPSVEHYASMIDLLGRAGRLDEAEALLKRETKIKDHSVALKALLGACRNHGNVEMEERITSRLFELDTAS